MGITVLDTLSFGLFVWSNYTDKLRVYIETAPMLWWVVLSILRWDNPEIRRPARVIMVDVDALAPIRHQGISIHHADHVIMVSYKFYYAIIIESR